MSMSAAQQAGTAARRATGNDAVRMLGRIGLVAYGVVHFLLGYLALNVALGEGGKASKSGALHTVAEQPGGKILLWSIAIGLAALAVWQVGEAVWGHQYVQPERRRTLNRLTSAGEAGLCVVLAYSAVKIATGKPSESGKTVEFTAKVLGWPGGQLLVGAVGLGIVAVGVYLVRRGLRCRFLEDLDLTGADRRARLVAERLGKVGWTALGLVYGTVGALVVLAAVNFDPAKASGLDTALKTLAAQPYGTLMLGLVAAGLACFGVYCLVDARYRRG
jgi:Domain of Unknown Function (DUF1206)